MEPDCYQVEVLYYLNPHLIWVEVIDNKRKEEFVIEQVGIYGVLPYETTIDGRGAGLKRQKCAQWAQAATVFMKESFCEAKEVWFRPTYIDRRNSIFDDNIHKYGELLLKISDTEIVTLSTVLIESGFALYDVCLFHQELSLGNFKTKLSSSKIKEVIKHLEKDTKNTSKKRREKYVKKQTTVFQAAQDLETTLTTQNLERHSMSLKRTTVDQLLEAKMKDFERCKDFDEESVGRASLVKKSEEEHKVSGLLRKKLELSKSQKMKPIEHRQHLDDPLKVLIATKQFLEENLKVCDNSDSVSGSELNTTEESDDIKNINKENKHSNKIAMLLKKSQQNSEKIKNIKQSYIEMRHSHKTDAQKTKEIESTEVTKPLETKEEIIEYEYVKRTAKKGKMKKPRMIPEYDLATEKLVAYGPPGLDPKVMTLKVVPKDNEDDVRLVSNVEDRKEVAENVKEMFGDVDSHIDLEITNKDILREKLKKNKDLNKEEKRIEVIEDHNTHSIIILDSDDDAVSEIIEKVNSEYPVRIETKKEEPKNFVLATDSKVVNVNPFKNIDASISVFVDKLVTPVLMVHSKMNKRIEPCSNIRDVNFNSHIHITLKNMNIERPMMLQMVSWPVILRGYSLFMISPLNSGKTLGYLPAVCSLITDCKTENLDSVGPRCIIVCATAQSVSMIERLARMFLGLDEKVLSCYAGMDQLHVTTSLLNGCDMFICTPTMLVRLLQNGDFGIDLRRLSTFVLEDCERLADVYANDIKYSLIKIKEMLKTRANKESKVQFVVASRIWCDFLEPLAKKVPNTVVCTGAFQECVLYSKANTSVNFVKKENKINQVLEFLKDTDRTKRTVIVCRTDEEVVELGKVLRKHKYINFTCNSSMTVEDLYNLNITWDDYQEPLLGPILICCDGNLNHLNVTNAHYLIHYSLPKLFSMFCKRFSVLNDYYPSIFKEDNDSVKIKILLEESNVEQLPKILNFIKRCTNNIPEFLDKVCEKILHEKDAIKGKNYVPICDSMLALGECPDFWNCQERHTVFKEYDDPKDWIPRGGVVTFKILHFHTAVCYSATLLSNSVGGITKKYPQSTVPLKMGMYFSKESNRKLLGIPKVGDICAVSVKQNFYARCQVLKILSYYNNGTPNLVLIKLIDEEKLEKAKDIYLFYLPDELKKIETHVVQVRLANIRPNDRDITFSDLAKDQLKKIIDDGEDLYMRGQIVLTIGNCLFVDNLDVCQELTSLKETVVRHNFKKELLNTHGIVNPDHIRKLEALCRSCDLIKTEVQSMETIKQPKEQPRPQWAHLEKDDLSSVFLASCENPGKFFVRLTKFEACMKLLVKDIDKYLEDSPKPVDDVKKGDVVLAKIPFDTVYERARVDDIFEDGKVKCFFVDQGDWKEVPITNLVEIPDNFITQLPFQAIECSLAGVKPAGDEWTEFASNWFYDNCFEIEIGRLKHLYVKYFTKEKAEYTDGNKYGVAIIDTNSAQDVVINQLMIDLNLAQANDDEIHYLEELKFSKAEKESNSCNDSAIEEDLISVSKAVVPVKTIDDAPKVSLDNIFAKKPIRSVPLVDSDNESDASDKWDVQHPAEIAAGFKFLRPSANKNTEPEKVIDVEEDKIPKLPVIKNIISSFEDKNNSANNNSTLDSDDLSTTEGSQLSENQNEFRQNEPTLKTTDETPTTKEIQPLETKIVPTVEIINQDELRKPKLLWRQTKSTVSIKIQLIDVQNYNLEIKDRSLKFTATCNDTKYGFEFDLYGVIDSSTAQHSNKGQYIFIKLCKVMKKTWLTLTKSISLGKWIVYDVDGLEISSDEEEVVENPLAEVLKNIHNKDGDSDSDDEDFLDDVNYEYKRDSD